MLFSQDFREFIALLNEEKVEYLIVGGYALAVHGVPRFTQDIDFWIGISSENTNKLLSVLQRFGFGSFSINQQDFSQKDLVIQLGYPPNRIDILTNIDGVTFEAAYANRFLLNINGLEIPFIGYEELLTNKKSSGRHQDLADIEQLEKLHKK